MRFKCRREHCLSVFEYPELGHHCPHCGATPEETYGETEDIVSLFSSITGITDRIDAVTHVLMKDLELAYELRRFKKTMSGWICPRDRHVLEQMVFSYKPSNPTILELGVAGGGCTNTFLTARQDASFIGVDNWESDYTEKDFWENCGQYKDRIELISNDTLEVGKSWNRFIDIILIDANHHYKYVLADITNFVPYMKPNGIIMLDDYHSSEVSKAVDETLVKDGYDLIRKPDPKYGIAEKLIVFRGKSV